MYSCALGSSHGGLEEALNSLDQSFEPTSFYTIISFLQKCKSSKSLRLAKRAYYSTCGCGLDGHMVIGNYLVNMFVQCGSISHAQQVFNRSPVRNEFTWTSLLQGFVDLGNPEDAIKLLKCMEENNINPTRYTLVAAVKACSKLKCIETGQQIHYGVIAKGLDTDPFLVSALVDMYAMCGLLTDAQDVFNKLPSPDVVCWTALMSGYAEQGHSERALGCLEQIRQHGIYPDVALWNAVILAFARNGESENALKKFAEIQEQGLLPNVVTFLNVLKACSGKAALRVGQQVNAQIHGPIFDSETTLMSSLIDMYGKCGSMTVAKNLFDAAPVRNVVTWNALITGYAHQGQIEDVFETFERMVDEKIEPDSVTFLNVLNVCCHGGLLDRAQQYFETMQKDHGIVPTIKHYNCMIDLLGRVGHLYEAVALMEQMPCEPNYVTWNSLLCSCQKWGDVELCKTAFEHALRLTEGNSAAFILMSNVCADVKKWNETHVIREAGHF